jgi:Ulp1 family protease
MDSLGGSHEDEADLLGQFIRVRNAVSTASTAPSTASTAPSVPPSPFKIIQVRVPKQPNFCDCGVYLLHFIEKFVHNSSTPSFLSSLVYSFPSKKYEDTQNLNNL